MTETAAGQGTGTAGAEGAGINNNAGTVTNDIGKGGAADAAKEFKAIGSQDELDRIVQNRIARERAKTADYDDLKTKASEYDKLQEAQKTELQKATDKATKADERATGAELTALRFEVAMEKGLTAVQAKRLVGKTKDELAADADELIASFKTDGDDAGKAAGLPKERLRGGGDPTGEVDETDPRKLAAGIQLY